MLLALSLQAQTEPDSPSRNYSLMPVPAQITPRGGEFRIDSSFRIAFEGYREARLERAAQSLIERLGRQTGLRIKHWKASAGTSAALTLACDRAGAEVQALDEDESYRLEVTSSGARISADQPLGILRGMETFLQLAVPGPDAFVVPAASISDSPRFPWRGLCLDVARHFMPLPVVERTLDGMAAVKLNVFHWHLSDNQGFRVESRRFPRLQQFGSNGQFYTQAEIRHVVAYARDRGIRVVPEFEMPGHSTAMLVAYPRLATPPAPREVDRAFGVLDPVIDPTKPYTYQFLDQFIGEMASLFPDAFFHIGGDEVNGKLWSADPAIQAFKAAHGLHPSSADPDANQALQAYFTRRVQAIVFKHGKQMEGWDEILTPDIPKSILIQSWRGAKSLSEAARLGYRGILSSGYYLDLMQPAGQHYSVDPLDAEAAALSPEQMKRILGGEAAMWTEYASPETADSRIWPRLAAIAERLWSPRDVHDTEDMYRRLEITSGRLEWFGLTHRSWQSPMLTRIAGDRPVARLRTLAGYLEPVKDYEREKFGTTTADTPLTSLIDAIPPESEPARRLNVQISRAIQTKSGWNSIRCALTDIRGSAEYFVHLPDENFLISPVSPLLKNMSEIVQLGLAAVDRIESGRVQSASEHASELERVRFLSTPRGACLVAIVPGIDALIDATTVK